MRRFIIVQNSIRTTYIFRYPYLKRLCKSNYVSIIAPNDDDLAIDEIKKLGAQVYNIPSLGEGILSKLRVIFLMNYYVLKERRRNSVFICHFLITFIMIFPSLLPFNKKCIVYTEGLGSLFSKDTLLTKLLKHLIGKPSIVRLFCNSNERDKIGKPGDIVTGGIGVDLKNTNSNFAGLHSDGYFRLLYVGRLIEDKGITDAINVLRILLNNGRRVKLNIVGDIYPSNPSSFSVDDILNYKNEFGDRINFVGYSDNVDEWYSQSNILLLPSKREGFPVCVMEASVYGIPTFGYLVPGMMDAVVKDVNGCLVDYSNVEALSAAVDEYLDLDKLRFVSERAKNHASKNFCQERKAENIVTLLCNI